MRWQASLRRARTELRDGVSVSRLAFGFPLAARDPERTVHKSKSYAAPAL
jgi:hypothetical protein